METSENQQNVNDIDRPEPEMEISTKPSKKRKKNSIESNDKKRKTKRPHSDPQTENSDIFPCPECKEQCVYRKRFHADGETLRYLWWFCKKCNTTRGPVKDFVPEEPAIPDQAVLISKPNEAEILSQAFAMAAQESLYATATGFCPKCSEKCGIRNRFQPDGVTIKRRYWFCRRCNTTRGPANITDEQLNEVNLDETLPFTPKSARLDPFEDEPDFDEFETSDPNNVQIDAAEKLDTVSIVVENVIAGVDVNASKTAEEDSINNDEDGAGTELNGECSNQPEPYHPPVIDLEAEESRADQSSTNQEEPLPCPKCSNKCIYRHRFHNDGITVKYRWWFCRKCNTTRGPAPLDNSQQPLDVSSEPQYIIVENEPQNFSTNLIGLSDGINAESTEPQPETIVIEDMDLTTETAGRGQPENESTPARFDQTDIKNLTDELSSTLLCPKCSRLCVIRQSTKYRCWFCKKCNTTRGSVKQRQEFDVSFEPSPKPLPKKCLSCGNVNCIVKKKFKGLEHFYHDWYCSMCKNVWHPPKDQQNASADPPKSAEVELEDNNALISPEAAEPPGPTSSTNLLPKKKRQRRSVKKESQETEDGVEKCAKCGNLNFFIVKKEIKCADGTTRFYHDLFCTACKNGWGASDQPDASAGLEPEGDQLQQQQDDLNVKETVPPSSNSKIPVEPAPHPCPKCERNCITTRSTANNKVYTYWYCLTCKTTRGRADKEPRAKNPNTPRVKQRKTSAVALQPVADSSLILEDLIIDEAVAPNSQNPEESVSRVCPKCGKPCTKTNTDGKRKLYRYWYCNRCNSTRGRVDKAEPRSKPKKSAKRARLSAGSEAAETDSSLIQAHQDDPNIEEPIPTESDNQAGAKLRSCPKCAKFCSKLKATIKGKVYSYWFCNRCSTTRGRVDKAPRAKKSIKTPETPRQPLTEEERAKLMSSAKVCLKCHRPCSLKDRRRASKQNKELTYSYWWCCHCNTTRGSVKSLSQEQQQPIENETAQLEAETPDPAESVPNGTDANSELPLLEPEPNVSALSEFGTEPDDPNALPFEYRPEIEIKNEIDF